VSTLLPEGTLRLSVDITDVQRPPADAPRGTAPVVIKYTQSGKPHTVRCGALVNTAPQVLQNLGYLRLDAEETALFKPVYFCRYFTTAVVLTPKPKETGMYVFVPPVSLAQSMRLREKNGPAVPLLSAVFDVHPYHGEVTAFTTTNDGASNRPPGVPYSADPGLVCAYSYSDVEMSTTQISAKAAQTLSAGTQKIKAEARETFSFFYYPRVSETELRNGWFEKLEAMQGRRGTYHAGGITTFWDVEQAMRSGQDLVARYF
jgi:hypothetical protein